MSDLDRGNDELLWTSLNCIEPLKTVVLVAPQGFEPRYAAPEAAVLPLNEGAIRQGDFTILRAGPTLVNPTRPERRWVDLKPVTLLGLKLAAARRPVTLLKNAPQGLKASLDPI
jgi:hypothetical protein